MEETITAIVHALADLSRWRRREEANPHSTLTNREVRAREEELEKRLPAGTALTFDLKWKMYGLFPSLPFPDKEEPGTDWNEEPKLEQQEQSAEMVARMVRRALAKNKRVVVKGRRIADVALSISSRHLMVYYAVGEQGSAVAVKYEEDGQPWPMFDGVWPGTDEWAALVA